MKIRTVPSSTHSALTVLAFTLMLSGATFAQVPSVGSLQERDCSTPIHILDAGGESYAVLTDLSGETSWQLSTEAKNGPALGAGFSLAEAAYQALPSWERAQTEGSLVSFALTFGSGHVARSGGFAVGFNFLDNTLVQQTGNSFLWLASSAELTLPDWHGLYTALSPNLQSFPRSVPGGVELAFAPLLDLPGSGEVDGTAPEPCVVVAKGSDPNAPAQDWHGMIVGYNVYRMEDTGAWPTDAELGRIENWIYFIPMAPDLSIEDDLHRVVDPDGEPSTGDEVLIFSDLRTDRDGSPRTLGSGPTDGLTYWYAIQPVGPGSVDDWASKPAFQPAPFASPELFEWDTTGVEPLKDLRLDIDGDGLHDAVNISGRPEPSGGPNGPEFFSPQAEVGLSGLGLTHAGHPVLSPRASTATLAVGEDCGNGSDDDGDGLADCDDRDCESHADCGDSGGGVVIGRPGLGEPGLVVGWDETNAAPARDLYRGSLAALVEARYDHAPEACGLTGGQAAVPMPVEDSWFVLVEDLDHGPGFLPSLGTDSFGRERPQALEPCP